MSYNPVLASETIASSGSGDDQSLAIHSLATCVEIFNSGSGIVTAFFGAVENVPGLPVPAGERATIYLPGGNQVSAMVLRFAAAGSVLAVQYLVAPTRGTAPGAPGTALVDAIVACTGVLGGGIPLAEGAESIGTVGLDAGENHVGQVGVSPVTALVTGTRADNATPYDQYDVVGFTEGLLETTLARVNGGCGTIVKTRCRTSQKTYAGPLRLWGYRVPAASLTLPSDGDAMTTMLANFPHVIGYIDLTFASEPGAASDAAYAMSTLPLDFSCAAGSKKIYWLAQHRGTAWTPANLQTFSVEFEVRGG